MPHVDVFLSHGFAQVWPPVVAVDQADADITFHNSTGAPMKVDLGQVPRTKGTPAELDVPDRRSPGTAHVDTVSAAGSHVEYDVYCDATAERARGLSHPIIIIR